MRRTTLVVSILFVLFLGYDLAISYDVADKFYFPLESYSRGSNILGTYNAVGNSKYHLGEDAEASATAKVYAVGNGQVKHARNHPASYDGSGNLIRNYGGVYIIEHTLSSGEKVCSLYAHLNFETFTKQEGDDVKKGEYIGQVGNSDQNGGWSEHLHLGIRKGAYPSDPSAHVCNDWIFSGYTSCKDVVDNWYSPVEFINTHGGIPTLPYRVVGNVAWYPPDSSCFYAKRWIYFTQGFPNGGMTIGTNQVCEDHEQEMINALGGQFSNWMAIIYGYGSLNEITECKLPY